MSVELLSGMTNVVRFSSAALGRRWNCCAV
jgi:hypothetical protein